MCWAVELRVGPLRLELLEALYPPGKLLSRVIALLLVQLPDPGADVSVALQRVHAEDSNELKLDPRDRLFIVHVGDKAERRKSQSAGRSGMSWDSGGPLIQPLQAIPPPASNPCHPAPCIDAPRRKDSSHCF